MSNIIKEFESKQLAKLKESKAIQNFKVGYTVSVKYKINESGNVRLQAFNGIVIAITKDKSNFRSTFTVRKISSGVGVERKFILHSPLVAGVEILKQGAVRRAKLNYLRKLNGKASRIKEKLDFSEESITS
jgi:large subunit ribosomal protein L19